MVTVYKMTIFWIYVCQCLQSIRWPSFEFTYQLRIHNLLFVFDEQHCCQGVDMDLPSVMTCANYLKLPPYSSKVINLPFSIACCLSADWQPFIWTTLSIRTKHILLFIFFLKQKSESRLSLFKLNCTCVKVFACTDHNIICLQERMRQRMLYAITEGQGSFHLS